MMAAADNEETLFRVYFKSAENSLHGPSRCNEFPWLGNSYITNLTDTIEPSQNISVLSYKCVKGDWKILTVWQVKTNLSQPNVRYDSWNHIKFTSRSMAQPCKCASGSCSFSNFCKHHRFNKTCLLD